jgi:hypothetical protein
VAVDQKEVAVHEGSLARICSHVGNSVGIGADTL